MVDITNEVKLAFAENRLAIFTSAIILFLSLILGYVLQPYLHSFLNPVVEDLTYKVQEGIIKVTFADIFKNNIRIVFQMFIYGALFCFSAVILSFNGLFVGYYVACQENLLNSLLLIIPHGIFEFSSIVFACSSGFVLFNFIFRFFKTIMGGNDFGFLDKIKYSFDINYIKLKQAVILLIIASVLMLIAGFVEAYLTIEFARFFT